jgi:hypothetical protein
MKNNYNFDVFFLSFYLKNIFLLIKGKRNRELQVEVIKK